MPLCKAAISGGRVFALSCFHLTPLWLFLLFPTSSRLGLVFGPLPALHTEVSPSRASTLYPSLSLAANLHLHLGVSGTPQNQQRPSESLDCPSPLSLLNKYHPHLSATCVKYLGLPLTALDPCLPSIPQARPIHSTSQINPVSAYLLHVSRPVPHYRPLSSLPRPPH